MSSGCIAGSQEVRIIILAGGRPVALVLLGDSWVPQNVVGAPPIHFGREDGVERTLLRVACQSETFLASPWQGDASIRYVGHIGCQSDFDELVSMACRPVDRGFCRMGETKVPFHPVKGGFGRRKSISMTFHPVKGGFGRTKLLIAEFKRKRAAPSSSAQRLSFRNRKLFSRCLLRMSHQVFVDKMLSELSTPMVFLKESSFVFASNGRRWHWCLCSRGALTASLFARSKQEHPTPNKNTLPKQRHPTQTTTTLKQGHTARPRTPARTKRFGKFLLNLPG